MRPPIYQPKGAAAEYGDYALNIYDGCPHACPYCYVPLAMHKDRAAVVEALERMERERERKRQERRERAALIEGQCGMFGGEAYG